VTSSRRGTQQVAGTCWSVISARRRRDADDGACLHRPRSVQLSQGQIDQAVQTWELGLEKCGKETITLNSLLAEVLISQSKLKLRSNTSTNCLRQPPAYAKGLSRVPTWFERGADLLKARLLLADQKTASSVELLRRVSNEGKGGAAGRFLQIPSSHALRQYLCLAGSYELAAGAFEDAASLRPESRSHSSLRPLPDGD